MVVCTRGSNQQQQQAEHEEVTHQDTDSSALHRRRRKQKMRPSSDRSKRKMYTLTPKPHSAKAILTVCHPINLVDVLQRRRVMGFLFEAAI